MYRNDELFLRNLVFLLENGANVNSLAEKQTILENVFSVGVDCAIKYAIVDILIEHGMVIDQLAFLLTIEYYLIPIAELFLQKCPHLLTLQNSNGETILHQNFSPYRKVDNTILKLLRSYGADLSIRDNSGRLPLTDLCKQRCNCNMFSCAYRDFKVGGKLHSLVYDWQHADILFSLRKDYIALAMAYPMDEKYSKSEESKMRYLFDDIVLREVCSFIG